MVKRLLIIGLLFSNLSVTGQVWEVGGFAGGSNYFVDITRLKIYSQETRVALGPLVRYNYSRHLSLKANLYYGTLSGKDPLQFVGTLANRGWYFRSTIFESGLQAEYNFLGYSCGDNRYSPYVFAGLGITYFNPKILYDGQWLPIFSVDSKGRELKFAKFQGAIPFGAGIKYYYRNGWNIGFEAGVRKTFSGYLGSFGNSSGAVGVGGAADSTNFNNVNSDNQPGTPPLFISNELSLKRLDWYVFAGIIVTKTFGCKAYLRTKKALETDQQECFDFDQ